MVTLLVNSLEKGEGKMSICRLLEDKCDFAGKTGYCTQPKISLELDCFRRGRQKRKKEVLDVQTGRLNSRETVEEI